MTKLPREFYQTDSITLAKSLLGKILTHDSQEGQTSGMIIETEAYMGLADAAAHTYKNKGKDGRTNILYSAGGFAYVYMIYGMYYCFNISANAAEIPECVLIRTVRPVSGLALMAKRRRLPESSGEKKLCGGPGKVCMAMGIAKAHNGADLLGENLYLSDSGDSFSITASKRINIGYAGEAVDYLYRFTID